MGPIEEFQRRNAELIEKGAADESLRQLTRQWFDRANAFEYSYHYAWMSRPIIQYPQDVMAMQEIIWQVKPDLIIETGIAHGGSLIMSASMLALLDYCDAVENGTTLDPKHTRRRVIGIDIDIREHNRKAMEAHPMSHRIDMIQGSSVDPAVVQRVHEAAKGYKRVLVCLDSNHTHDHVLQELEAYASLTSMESYCVVFDTVVEDLPDEASSNRPWGKGNNPKTAVHEYLRRLDANAVSGSDGAPLHFEIDKTIENKLLITVAPDGFLKRVQR
ncbi:cephalosporin hydroxylase family protein [Cupriavidus pauculus]|jgi:cephalosporin hydroxylase|uniref:cephalosporin hydroxylase family protein n=1 Tax=Cupriavidus pauculus TaxID=82633 RepID=UPI0030FBC87D